MMIEFSLSTLLGLGVPTFLALGGAMWGTIWWAVRHYFVRRTEFDQAVMERNGHFSRQDARLASLEARMDELPTSEQLAGLRGDFRALGAQMDGLAAAQQAMNRQIEMLNRFLLERRQ